MKTKKIDWKERFRNASSFEEGIKIMKKEVKRHCVWCKFAETVDEKDCNCFLGGESKLLKRFDKRFPHTLNHSNGKDYGGYDPRDDIKSFIQSEIDQSTQDAVEAERKLAYREGYSDATSIVLEPNHTYRRGVRDGVEAERARLESLIPEKRKMEDCHCLYSEGCGCGVRDFNKAIVIMQEAVKRV